MPYEINKYGFDFDGNTYLTQNNPIDITNDFTVAVKFLVPNTPSSDEIIMGSYSWTSSGDDLSCYLRYRATGILNFVFGGSDDGYPSADVDLNSHIGNIVTVVFSVRTLQASLMFNSLVVNASGLSSLTNNITPMIIGGIKSHTGVVSGEFNGVIVELLTIQDTLTDNQLLEFANLDKLSNHTDYSTFNKNAYYDFDTQTTDDQSGGNDATVTGVEQYAIIGTETVYGTKCTKTETFEQDANDTFDELIYDWFYGGTIKIEVDNLAWKTIKILAYDDESNSYLPIKVETTTLREHTIVIPKTATRRLKLSIDSDSTFTTVVYTLESIFDVINDTDSNSSGAVAIDYNVIYSDVNIEKRSMSFRVNDDDAHFAQSILQNKVYLDNEIHQITSLQVSELDVNRKEFKCDFLRLLNE